MARTEKTSPMTVASAIGVVALATLILHYLTGPEVAVSEDREDAVAAPRSSSAGDSLVGKPMRTIVAGDDKPDPGTPEAGAVMDPLHELVLHCVEFRPGGIQSPLPGMVVGAFPGNRRGSALRAISVADGSARINGLVAGEYYIGGIDPRGILAMASDIDASTLRVRIPSGPVALAFTPRYVAHFELAGDETISVGVGRHSPGLALEAVQPGYMGDTRVRAHG